MENDNILLADERALYAFRYLARIILQAETPLAVGSGKYDVLTHAPVMRDVNGLPFIPGTTLAGVLRHAIREEDAKPVFGYQPEDKSDPGSGSRLLFTEARMIGSDGTTVLDGLQPIDYSDPFYRAFRNLPVRQHVRIDSKGTACDGGKFDEEVVYKGTRFCFEIELIGETKDEIVFFKEKLRAALYNLSFRLGSGTRKGHGKMSVYSYKEKTLDLSEPEELEMYLHKSVSLSDTSFPWEDVTPLSPVLSDEWITYEVRLTPKDFFLFGSGFGNEKADITPVKESVTDYEKGAISDEYILIPATSVKGALSHRIAYYYNYAVGYFAGADKDKKTAERNGGGIGTENLAVSTLFGYEKDTLYGSGSSAPGNVFLSDLLVFLAQDMPPKLLNHVSIDRFTGGALDGALFSEQTTWGNHRELILTLLVQKKALPENKPVQYALEAALNDLCNGLLPLGGGVNRGNGIFTGSWKITSSNK